MIQLLNSIHPPMYNYLPIITILIFEVVVVFIELGVFAIVEEEGFKKKKELNDEEVWRMGLKAIVLGNIVTFLIGMFVYLLIGGSL